MKQSTHEAIRLFVFNNRDEMGRNATRSAADLLRQILTEKKEANIVFAAAPSQIELLRHLRNEQDIDWDRVNAFHMDEYIGLSDGDPRRFTAFLDETIFRFLPFKTINRLDSSADPVLECRRYEALLRANVPDLVLMGIGENGHIAFNDPPAAFDEQSWVKVVELDSVCRQQQVNDGCFPDFDSVPTRAVTLTVPALTTPARIVCVVPGQRKAQAVRDTLLGPITPACPASILRQAQGDVRMFVDTDAARLLGE